MFSANFKTPQSLAEVEEAYTLIRGRIGASSAHGQTNLTFFEAYYGGFSLLRTSQDYYDLAIAYFEKAAEMNVRYCEPFFDPQGHTRRGVGMDVLMKGLRRAQVEAEGRLNVGVFPEVWNLGRNGEDADDGEQIKSQWIMCILRDMSPESAMEAYNAALPYKDMIVGVGLDSDELDRPPSLFKEVFVRAKADGFKLTAHCDFNQKDTHSHIRQVVKLIGAQRIDHGMNAADSDDLVEMIKAKDTGMTLCPCAYIRHTSDGEVFPRIRKLFDVGIKVAIASDDPAYMEDNWVLNNLLMVKDKCKFSDKDIAQLQRNAVEMCWANEGLKQELLREIDDFVVSDGLDKR